MDKSVLCCDVCCCKHNVDGCKCDKSKITITTGKKSDSAHFCDDYEK
ncbi:MAG: DUF1540 domain-containing protein [Clostridia bacterium]